MGLKAVAQGKLVGGTITAMNDNFGQEWTLDQLGNWTAFKQDDDGNGSYDLNQTRTHNEVNEIEDITNSVGSAWIDPVHDAAGNMTEMPSPLAPTSSLLATYDAWNRMVKLEDGMTTVLTNEYDGNHHRIVKDVTGGDTHDYYYNEMWQLLTETVDGSTYALYAWHLYYVDALAVRMRAADMYYFLHDANFNVTAAYNITAGSGSDRTVTERYKYTPYGEVTVLNGDFTLDSSGMGDGLSDIGNYHLYTGRERDPETGLQLNRMRWYHAPLGRWVSRDPIGYEADQFNLYSYVHNPLSFVDSYGLKKDDRGVTKRYCDAMFAHPDNKWLACACRVSRIIDASLAAMTSSAIWIGIWEGSENNPDWTFIVNRIKWFKCTRSCMARKWGDAYDVWEGREPENPVTDAWQKCIDECPLGKQKSRECCVLQVEAEQKGLQECTKKCGQWTWGNSFPISEMPDWDPKKDFNNLNDRIEYGIKKCCDGDAFSGR